MLSVNVQHTERNGLLYRAYTNIQWCRSVSYKSVPAPVPKCPGAEVSREGLQSTRHTVNSTQSHNSTHTSILNTQQFNCSALGLCSRRKANISEDRLNRNSKVVCTCIFCWSCLPTRWCSLTCISCHQFSRNHSAIVRQQINSTRDATARLCH